MRMKAGGGRGRLAWAVIGGLVLIGTVLALVIGALNDRSGPDPSPSLSNPTETPSSSSPPEDGVVVDPDVVSRRWVPEPITRDPDLYARAALEAAGTFDTQLTTRAEWVAWLGTWFTASPLYDDAQDALDQMAGYKAELDQAVVLPQPVWDDLAGEDGRVTARVVDEIDMHQLPEMVQARMWTATADVVMTYTRDAEGDEVSYDETVRVSVQLVCGGESIPAPGSAQRAGDCKVVRFFDEAVN